MKRLGIIGGLGPMATAYFLQLITDMTQADIDQQHIESIIYNCPSIPDRTEFILNESGESPLPAIIDIGRKLVAQEVSQIAIPCITAHYFHKELEDAIGAQVIHGILESVKYLSERHYKRVGVMATDATVKTGLFSSELNKEGIQCIYPSEEGQICVMELIYHDIKAGRTVDINKFRKVSEELFQAGAEVILLGCTELSMIKKDYQIGSGYLDVLEVLAKCCTERCGQLRAEYQELITK